MTTHWHGITESTPPVRSTDSDSNSGGRDDRARSATCGLRGA
eukprot:CAMPEP_0196744866 /NCGR_PEP_ID=MMETSP1091-20130531/59239_1 /TAXON_ID=302021 /ORGANISM="Rhodomonas sp., Strain CCMP768" /LENGTH=41 /DNA_ID= /DNA_START= /DNA_END= /DNA_ORIENTATION=